jgi:hypothetical protein
MTAKEARELALSKLKDTDQIRENIDVMAKAGNMYAVLDLKKIREPELSKAVLEAEGFKVELSQTHFSITW